MRDEQLKEQMEKETIGSWTSPALDNINKKDVSPLVFLVSAFIAGVIVGVIIG